MLVISKMDSDLKVNKVWPQGPVSRPPVSTKEKDMTTDNSD